MIVLALATNMVSLLVLEPNYKTGMCHQDKRLAQKRMRREHRRARRPVSCFSH